MPRVAALFLALAIFGAPHPAAAQTTACADLPKLNLALVQDAPSRIQTVTNRAVDSACVIDGYTNPAIGWRAWLPAASKWNGKLAQDGCGGRCGARKDEACELLMKRGYACIAPDLGFAGANQDRVWALDNLQGEIDVAFRATHVTNVIGRHLIHAVYGRAPAHAYYVGISNAGRQGLIEAQRFPRDFDGIIAGEPPMRGTAYKDEPPPMDWAAGLLAPNGKAAFTVTEIEALHAAVLARCDADDGLRDGIISDPRTCAFDPAAIQCSDGTPGICLTAAQVGIVRQAYAGHGLRFTGQRLMPGTELLWIGPYIGRDGGPGRYGPKPDDGYRYPYAWVFNDSSNPDLRPFKTLGGKLIMFQGWDDEIALSGGAVDFYETVERVMGNRAATQDFFRLFTIPGQGHTPGGPGAEVIDYLTALENWVEHGQTPDLLKAHHLKDSHRFFAALIPAEDLAPANIVFTRPAYPYPVQTRYLGYGDPNDWQSFGPVRSR